MSSSNTEDVSQLAERDLRARLEKYHDELQQQEVATLPSLMSLTADRIVQDLEESTDIDLALSQLVEGLDPVALRLVLNNPKASYRLLRAFHNLRLDSGQQAIDIDEAIIHNECYLRSRSNNDGAYLVTFSELVDSLSGKASSKDDALHVEEEVSLDTYWTKLSARPDDDLFSRNFDVITSGLFRDLDWNNVFLAGPLPLATMIHTDFRLNSAFLHSKHGYESVFYVYGLNAEDGYRKVEHIHDTCIENITTPSDTVVVKSLGAISIVPNPPHHHIRIVLKLFPSPTDVLLDVNHDLHAVAFNGSSVYMLPRCARAVAKKYFGILSEGFHEIPGPNLGRLQESMDKSLSTQIEFQKVLFDPLLPLDTDEDDHYNTAALQNAIYRDHYQLFADMKQAICKRLCIQDQANPLYRGYLTRRIRRHVSGNDFQEVMEKQLTLPLFIPCQLEDYLTRRLGEDYPEQASLIRESLIPVHDSKNYDAAQSSLPSLTDTTTGYGNLRYWVVTNTALWAGQDRVLDEVAETLQALHFLSTNASYNTDKLSTFGPAELRQWHDFRQTRNHAM